MAANRRNCRGKRCGECECDDSLVDSVSCSWRGSVCASTGKHAASLRALGVEGRIAVRAGPTLRRRKPFGWAGRVMGPDSGQKPE